MIELVMIKMLGCGPCRHIEPIAKKIAEENNFKFKVIIGQDMPQQLRPYMYPYFYIYKDKKILDHWAGANENKLKYSIKKYDSKNINETS